MSPQECIILTHKHPKEKKIQTCMAYKMFNFVMFLYSPGWLKAKVKYANHFEDDEQVEQRT